ncbi:YhcN/YlaJ family sporulation lipoprotein [Oceanobacillus manasiensis]|uniref:YhcN/YlaJ family sporulation lipoprotein n=1 Tax=Oceanobacillus manasiensis TaxID=586413 RepID=UPI0005A801A1|nr:YhcN/YlaJ family sporulation lipoprotein [Oceanobacillus manasiensis]
MKIKHFAIGVCTLLSLTACGTNDNAMDERDDVVNQLDPSVDQQSAEDEELNDRLGYVHYTKDQVDNNDEMQQEATIDRTQVANTITRLALSGEGLEQVATLVTDEEVLIAYEKTEDVDEKEAATIARKTAQSVIPQYYEIYVSDNESLIQDIQSLHNSRTTNDDYDNTIDQIIKEMEKSPQGNEDNQMNNSN